MGVHFIMVLPGKYSQLIDRAYYIVHIHVCKYIHMHIHICTVFVQTYFYILLLVSNI